MSPPIQIRDACGVSKTRSRLTTGMPARIASRPTEVSCLPSFGSRTMTSTFLLISVRIAAICAVTSLVGCTDWHFTSVYFAASGPRSW